MWALAGSFASLNSLSQGVRGAWPSTGKMLAESGCLRKHPLRSAAGHALTIHLHLMMSVLLMDHDLFPTVPAPRIGGEAPPIPGALGCF